MAKKIYSETEKRLVFIFVITGLLFLGSAMYLNRQYLYRLARPDILELPETYLACGCGCCGNEASEEICLYKSKGDSLEEIKQKDQASRQAPACITVGCSLGTLYKYCD